MGEFHSPLKKPKLSESSLQRVTPDSGIALGYQSSVSSVDSLSPPMDKLHRDDFAKFDSSNGVESVSQEKRSRSMSELGSSVASVTLAPSGVTTTVGSYRTMSSASSVVSHFPTSPQSPAGTIPLSHAPHTHGSSTLDMTRSPSLLPPRSNSSSNSPIHPQSSPNITHSPAGVGSPFQFNSSSPLAHHYPSTVSHPPSNFLSYPSASHNAGSIAFSYPTSSNYYNTSSRLPYSNPANSSYHTQSSYQLPSYRSYAQQSSSQSFSNSTNTSSTSPFKLVPVSNNTSLASSSAPSSLPSVSTSSTQQLLHSTPATTAETKSTTTIEKPLSLPVVRTGSCGDSASSPSSDAKDNISDDPESPTSSEQFYTKR